MTNKQSANSKATHDDNLITLEDKSQDVKRASDINNKIITLEDNLGDLQTELNEVNMSVVEGLDRLNDSDLDLTSKVTETYKRLGEIDHTYKSLSGILDNIDSDVKNWRWRSPMSLSSPRRSWRTSKPHRPSNTASLMN